MSATAPALTVPFTRRVEIAVEREQVVESVAHLPVCFHLTRRVDVRLLPWWKRRLYCWLCRNASPKRRVPPIPPMTRGVFLDFDEADAYCTSPDDQIHLIPVGWAYSGETVDADLVCRPRDPRDSAAYHQMRERFDRSREHDRRLTALEERVGRLEARCADDPSS